MGWRQKLKRSVSRTTLALVLTVVAVAVPCSFWFIAGWRTVQQDIQRANAEQEHSARTTAQQLAERLRGRLEALRKAEERRPFYHYQNLIHDPNGAYEGASVHPSPLADGPSDPYILAYFQINPAGQLTLPTLNDEVPQPDKAPEEIERQRNIRKQLDPAVAVCQSVFRSTGASNASAAGASAASNVSQDRVNMQLQIANLALAKMGENLRVVEMKSEAWTQNAMANAVYLGNNGGEKNDQVNRQIRETKPAAIYIRIGSLQWHTIPFGNQPALAALREVITPEGRQIQGFVVSTSSATDALQGAAFPVTLIPPGAEGKQVLIAPIGDTGWHVGVDTAHAMATAGSHAMDAGKAFLHLFLMGITAAVVAGCCVVGLVWQSERLARQRSQFAATAAHELRTPLAGLRMYSDMLADGLGNPARSKEYAMRLADEAERLGRVISNVLGFTQLERGTLNINVLPGDLGAAVKDTVTRQQPALAAAGAQVEFACSDRLPTVSCDPDAVATILQNLLDNAEKHTRSATDRRIRVSLTASHDGITLAVADHGPGIPVRMRRRLFRAFVRGTDADAPAGLGLGLALAEALVRAHGGNLTCSETPGGGATFTALFPTLK